MNARRNNRWKLVAIAALFALPVLAAFVLHQAGYEPRAERNHGMLLDPPQDFVSAHIGVKVLDFDD